MAFDFNAYLGAVTAGESPVEAQAAAKRTTAFYTGERAPGA